MCTLDLSKAFNRINLYIVKLMQINLLVQLLALIELRFRVFVTCVN